MEKNQVGKREDLADWVIRVDAKTTPFSAMIEKGKPLSNSLVQYQHDDYEDAEDNAAIDGEDVKSFDNASQNRALLKTYVQKFMDSAMVSDFAEELSDVAGINSEITNSINKKLVKIGRDIEAAFCSDNEHQEGSGGVPYKLRGAGMWLNPGASQTTFKVPTAYETPSTSLNNTAMASLTEVMIQDMLQSAYERTGKIQRYTLLTGPTLKRQFTNFTRTQFSTNNSASGLRTFNSNAEDRKIISTVDIYEGDFGSLELIPTLYNAKFTSAAAIARRGYLILPDLWQQRFKRYPRVKKLENQGGGERFLVDAICTLVCKSPLPQGKFYATT